MLNYWWADNSAASGASGVMGMGNVGNLVYSPFIKTKIKCDKKKTKKQILVKRKKTRDLFPKRRWRR